MEYRKVKSAAKDVRVKGPELRKLILRTMKTISDAVGSTLGPCGCPVLIERFEHGLPPTITKDGVTVFRAIGFTDATAQCVCETARDAAVRTVTEAGDGTTTGTVLAEAAVRYVQQFCENHPKASPQRVGKVMEQLFKDVIEPSIRKQAITADLGTPVGRERLLSVASVSANGEKELAEAVLQCFDMVGDNGNVTITESSGPSAYEVERIEGFPIQMGYEESCAIFAPKFVNDGGRQMSVLNNPVYLLYNGTLSNPTEAFTALTKVGDKFEELLQGIQTDYTHNTVVVIAAGFSEQVLATFAAGWDLGNTIKVFPLVVPKSIITNYQAQFLEDVSAITGATIFNPISRPLETATLEDFGPGTKSFEASRYRSTILGTAGDQGEEYKEVLLERIEEVEQQVKLAASDLDKVLLQERLAKLSNGIAKLKVIGSSNGELKERRDRAEDAVCAVRGAIKHGCLPGGGWALQHATAQLFEYITEPRGTLVSDVVHEIMVPMLNTPLNKLLENCGMSEDEIRFVTNKVYLAASLGTPSIYDALEDRFGDAFDLGVLDAVPAVVEAIRSSLSIAVRLGTLGAVVVFARDNALESREASDTQAWLRDTDEANNPLNFRS
jgi:chaperonin GroEL